MGKQTNWHLFFKEQFSEQYFVDLKNFINHQSDIHNVFPKQEQIFACFDFFNFEETKVVIIGQDPYYKLGLAHGLAFSVDNNNKSKSLTNIFKELQTDLKISRNNYDLTDWAEQGVLLLNRILTVNEGIPNSHVSKGWEQFTDFVIEKINRDLKNVVFILWGKNAEQLEKKLDKNKHLVIVSSHPSPLSAYVSFFGSRPFSKTNDYLKANNLKPISW